LEIYLVGGAVRDALLGLSGSDRDWVVVGATPAQMLAQGFVPVGRDFPVFLHPESREEHALARTERKTGMGYKGFVVHASPEVTLEQDLARRDLTINAMAQDVHGRLIDPYGGQTDLARKVLRHVTEAFREDPVRILRLARFAARFGDFQVASETLALCQEMVALGEVDALVPERVWQELERGLMTSHPMRMAQVLVECGAWTRLWPEIKPPNVGRDPPWTALRFWDQASLACRWALWLSGTSAAHVQQINERLRVPAAVADIAWAWAEYRPLLMQRSANAEQATDLLHRLDVQRRPQRASELIELAFRSGVTIQAIEAAQNWRQALQAVLAVDAKAVTQKALAQGLSGPALGQALLEAHTQAIAQSRQALSLPNNASPQP
jgi:tRNA nucleotidyltransferase (CCA-adding enzyme)